MDTRVQNETDIVFRLAALEDPEDKLIVEMKLESMRA